MQRAKAAALAESTNASIITETADAEDRDSEETITPFIPSRQHLLSLYHRHQAGASKIPVFYRIAHNDTYRLPSSTTNLQSKSCATDNYLRNREWNWQIYSRDFLRYLHPRRHQTLFRNDGTHAQLDLHRSTPINLYSTSQIKPRDLIHSNTLGTITTIDDDSQIFFPNVNRRHQQHLPALFPTSTHCSDLSLYQFADQSHNLVYLLHGRGGSASETFGTSTESIYLQRRLWLDLENEELHSTEHELHIEQVWQAPYSRHRDLAPPSFQQLLWPCSANETSSSYSLPNILHLYGDQTFSTLDLASPHQLTSRLRILRGWDTVVKSVCAFDEHSCYVGLRSGHVLRLDDREPALELRPKCESPWRALAGKMGFCVDHLRRVPGDFQYGLVVSDVTGEVHLWDIRRNSSTSKASHSSAVHVVRQGERNKISRSRFHVSPNGRTLLCPHSLRDRHSLEVGVYDLRAATQLGNPTVSAAHNKSTNTTTATDTGDQHNHCFVGTCPVRAAEDEAVVVTGVLFAKQIEQDVHRGYSDKVEEGTSVLLQMRSASPSNRTLQPPAFSAGNLDSFQSLVRLVF